MTNLSNSNLRPDAPSFTPSSYQPKQNASRNQSANQIAQMKAAFAMHPLLQQAMFLQNEYQSNQKKLKKKTKTTKKNETNETKGSSKFGSSSGGALELNEKPKPYKRVLAINLPSNLQTIDAVTAVFHPYGDVTLVRVLKPGKQLPFDTKQYASKIPELGSVTCALIDFETARAAKFAVHVLRQRADEIGFRLALLKPGIEEKLYENELELKDFDKIESQNDSGVTSETSSGDTASDSGDSESQLSHLSNERSRISSSDGDVDSDLNNSRASISSEDEHKNEKLLKDHLSGNIESKRHSLTTSDTDYSIDLPIKPIPKKHNRVVSSLTIFLANPQTTNQKPNPEIKNLKTYTREELLNRQYPCIDLENPFRHVFAEIERSAQGAVQKKTSSKLENNRRNNRNKNGFRPKPITKPRGFLSRA